MLSFARHGFFAACLAGLTLPVPAWANGNLVDNGGFEQFSGASGPGQIAPAISDTGLGNIGRVLASWTKTCLVDCTGGAQGTGSQGFAFLVNNAADSAGFQSVFSPPTIKMWGPDSGSSNDFSGSPDGGYFLGIDGSYGRSSLEQLINGLTVGTSYKLAFQYAGGQFTDATGATDQYWKVDFGADTASTPTMQVPSKGFSGWQNAAIDFVAGSTSQVLKFTAFGGTPGTGPNFAPGGLPPFLLLDGVSLSPNDPPTPPSVPAPLPVFGATAGLMLSRKLRRRIRHPHQRP